LYYGAARPGRTERLTQTIDTENTMKLLFPRLIVVTLSAASLWAEAALRPSDLLGEPTQAPSVERAIVTKAADRTIIVTPETKWVNVKHFEVIRFVSNGREFMWAFNGIDQPRPFDLMQIAPAGFVDRGVTVYVSPSDRDNPS
jgi:heavy-metal resistance protein CzcE